MPTDHQASIAKKLLWTGRIVSAVPVLLLFMSAGMKLAKVKGLDDGFAHLGWPIAMAGSLACLEIMCAVIYLNPRSAVLGAILLTGFLGGAIATHVRVGDPTYIQILLGVLVWGGLYLREPKLQALLPWRR